MPRPYTDRAGRPWFAASVVVRSTASSRPATSTRITVPPAAAKPAAHGLPDAAGAARDHHGLAERTTVASRPSVPIVDARLRAQHYARASSGQRRESMGVIAMRIAVIGGGPGGLYVAALAKRLDPAREITVWERNAPDDTFGFGVVFSDETLGGIEHADPVDLRRAAARVRPLGRHRHRSTAAGAITSGGHGFAALGRQRLLQILHERCAAARRRAPLPDEAPDRGRAVGRRTTWSSPPTGCTATRARRTPTCSGPRWTTRALPVHLARHRQGRSTRSRSRSRRPSTA